MAMRITINTSNAAFDNTKDNNGRADECAVILRKLANKLNETGMPPANDSWALYDANGNKVGDCSSS